MNSSLPKKFGALLKKFRRSSPDGRRFVAAVIDAHPRFACEAALWAECIATLKGCQPVLYLVGCSPPNLIAFAREKGIEIRTCSHLYPEAPHCSKYIPFDDLCGQNVAVLDCDLFPVRDFTPFLSNELIRLPPNNHANPAWPVFSRILKAAGFEGPEPSLALFKGGGGRDTDRFNVSAGLIWLPGVHSVRRNRFRYWAEWLLANRDRLEFRLVNVDQIAIALAIREDSAAFSFLPAHTNAILQLLPEINQVFALHLTSGHISQYPTFFNNRQLVAQKINPILSADIERLNTRIRRVLPYLDRWPETRDFSKNFLNPSWRRPAWHE